MQGKASRTFCWIWIMANTDVSESILSMLTCHLKTSSCVWFHVCGTVVFLCSPLRFLSFWKVGLDVMFWQTSFCSSDAAYVLVLSWFDSHLFSETVVQVVNITVVMIYLYTLNFVKELIVLKPLWFCCYSLCSHRL